MPLIPCSYSLISQLRPSSWYGRIAPFWMQLGCAVSRVPDPAAAAFALAPCSCCADCIISSSSCRSVSRPFFRRPAPPPSPPPPPPPSPPAGLMKWAKTSVCRIRYASRSFALCCCPALSSAFAVERTAASSRLRSRCRSSQVFSAATGFAAAAASGSGASLELAIAAAVVGATRAGAARGACASRVEIALGCSSSRAASRRAALRCPCDVSCRNSPRPQPSASYGRRRKF